MTNLEVLLIIGAVVLVVAFVAIISARRTRRWDDRYDDRDSGLVGALIDVVTFSWLLDHDCGDD